MTTTEFKVDDRVREKIGGLLGTVVGLSSSSGWIVYVLWDGNDEDEACTPDELELWERPSSDRTEFKGGGMRDAETGKPRFDLLLPEQVPYEAQYLTRIARLMAKGADHYEGRNWEKFDDQEALNRARSSAFRHFMQWFNGETDEDHAASIFFNVQAVEYIKWRMENASE